MFEPHKERIATQQQLNNRIWKILPKHLEPKLVKYAMKDNPVISGRLENPLSP